MGTTSPATATGGGIDIEKAGGASVRLDDTTNSVTGELQVYSSGMNLATTTNHNIIISPNNSEIARFTTDGLTFNGDTASANALDDYEEGTFTVNLYKGGSALAVTTRYGYYTKIGDLLYISLYWYNTSVTTTGSSVWTIGDIPFTMKTATNSAYASIPAGYLTLGTNFFINTPYRWQTNAGTKFTLYGSSSTSNVSSQTVEIAASGVVRVA